MHRRIMVSPVCGFDQWIDNHYAYDGDARLGFQTDLSVYANHVEKLGLQYHWWALPGGNTQLYVVDPTGFGVQFDGSAKNPPANLPTYSAACKSNDGCAGQGKCTSSKEFLKFLQN